MFRPTPRREVDSATLPRPAVPPPRSTLQSSGALDHGTAARVLYLWPFFVLLDSSCSQQEPSHCLLEPPALPNLSRFIRFTSSRKADNSPLSIACRRFRPLLLRPPRTSHDGSDRPSPSTPAPQLDHFHRAWQLKASFRH